MQPDRTHPSPDAGLTRRRLLGSALALGAGTLVLGGAAFRPAFAAGEIAAPDFLALSEFLTGHKGLDAGIADRALAALAAEDAAFPAEAAALKAAIAGDSFSDMRQFAGFAARHPDLQPVAMKIISAWYLGYTGTPSGNSTVDDARFVTYAGALMYQPTIDATVIPSYARGHTNYWAEPPASIARD